MTQTLAACDFEYIVIEPDNYNVPPAFTASNNARLIRAGEDFTMEIVLQNTGSCAWPDGVRLTYNADLTQNPDETVNMAPLNDDVPHRSPPRPELCPPGAVEFLHVRRGSITGESNPITIIGIAPNVFGCYYGVWDLLYPNSDLTIGRPLVLTIRVWGGG